MTNRVLNRIGLLFLALVVVSPAVLFFLWMLSLSLKFEIDNGAYPPILIPERFAWSNYAQVFRENNFLLYLWNSIVVTGAATALALLIGVPAGYGIARLKAQKAAVVVMIARMTPGLSYLIPLYLLFQWVGLVVRHRQGRQHRGRRLGLLIASHRARRPTAAAPRGRRPSVVRWRPRRPGCLVGGASPRLVSRSVEAVLRRRVGRPTTGT